MACNLKKKEKKRERKEKTDAGVVCARFALATETHGTFQNLSESETRGKKSKKNSRGRERKRDPLLRWVKPLTIFESFEK